MIFYQNVAPDFSNLSELIYAMFETIDSFFWVLYCYCFINSTWIIFSTKFSPNYFIYLVCKTIVIFFRAIPEFIIAMILVIAIGFGAMPGVLALGLHTMGFLAKFYAEDIEHINRPMSLKSSGATKVKLFHLVLYANSTFFCC